MDESELLERRVYGPLPVNRLLQILAEGESLRGDPIEVT
jgi:hypothetical protein